MRCTQEIKVVPYINWEYTKELKKNQGTTESWNENTKGLSDTNWKRKLTNPNKKHCRRRMELTKTYNQDREGLHTSRE